MPAADSSPHQTIHTLYRDHHGWLTRWLGTRLSCSEQAADTARRRHTGALDREALSERIDAIIASYDRDFFRERRRFGIGADQPVFIVGLPRSGITLTEQIIASHTLLHGAGELPDLARIATQNIADDDLP